MENSNQNSNKEKIVNQIKENIAEGTILGAGF